MTKPVNMNELEDELLQRAFDADEDTPIPEDYVLDEIHERSIDFLKAVDKERKLMEMKSGKAFVKNENVKGIDIVYSLNVDNNSKFAENYERLGINRNWINEIIREFKIQLRNSSKDSQNTNNGVKKMNFDEIINKYKLHKENLMQCGGTFSSSRMSFPNDQINSELSAIITNKICIRLLLHFEKLFNSVVVNGSSSDEDKTEKDSNYSYIIMLWIYSLLLMLKTPLVDDDNSALYSLNKNIYKYLNKYRNTGNSSSVSYTPLKIIHVIISEVFSQKILLRSIN